MSACKIVTIKNKIPLYKNEEKANSVELLELEEFGYNIVSGIGNFNVGDKALFIEPDYNIPDTEMFSEYYRPDGDPRKSKLGLNGRIRAVRFNLHKGDGFPVYSYGVLMPISDIKLSEDLDKQFNIKKFETIINKKRKKLPNFKNPNNPFPLGMYKTDEENINNLWGNIEYPIELVGTQKIDGSSVTISSEFGICSRNNQIPFTIKKCISRRKANLFERLLLIVYKIFKIRKKIDLCIYGTVKNDDSYIIHGKSIFDKLVKYSKDNNIVLSLRGEINGQKFKGSGNSLNPTANLPTNIKFFGLDYKHEDGIYKKTTYTNLTELCNILELETCPFIFRKTFNSKQEIIDCCEEIFNNGNMIEGIVLNTEDYKFHAKYMNMYYDSKKK